MRDLFSILADERKAELRKNAAKARKARDEWNDACAALALDVMRSPSATRGSKTTVAVSTDKLNRAIRAAARVGIA